ncbi:hypothetical protein ABW21_db0209581 [Orbilia brochopaga]|nr:hypothetical protein ABW21_db0209581 [Drechslerella brochopaga]
MVNDDRNLVHTSQTPTTPGNNGPSDPLLPQSVQEISGCSNVDLMAASEHYDTAHPNHGAHTHSSGARASRNRDESSQLLYFLHSEPSIHEQLAIAEVQQRLDIFKILEDFDKAMDRS